MTWKKNIDDIKVICKKCNQEMIVESNRNGVNGIFVCNWCKDHINLNIKI